MLKAAADPNQGAVFGRDYANTRFSPLNQINTQNAPQLKLAWAACSRSRAAPANAS
ncbi:MAG: hypothetical protein JO122_20175 [Acetobacteraceae bacterium]|nr:hypothetical protein [Acetobacteraceae bacterium]